MWPHFVAAALGWACKTKTDGSTKEKEREKRLESERKLINNKFIDYSKRIYLLSGLIHPNAQGFSRT